MYWDLIFKEKINNLVPRINFDVKQTKTSEVNSIGLTNQGLREFCNIVQAMQNLTPKLPRQAWNQAAKISLVKL